MAFGPRGAQLVRIETARFAAGLLVNESGRVVAAAPILKVWVGRGVGEVAAYCRRQGWQMECLPLKGEVGDGDRGSEVSGPGERALGD